MCLLIFAYRAHSDYKLIVAANRDEFYDRPTEPAKFWNDHPDLLAGRDLKAGGTWLGITRDGRFAAITNYRNPKIKVPDAPSRGTVVKNYLTGKMTPKDFFEKFSSKYNNYNGFNFVFGSVNELYYFTNQKDELIKISPGIHGLSNAFLDTPWQKVEKAKKEFAKLLSKQVIDEQSIFNILFDDRPAEDSLLPDTGVGLEIERLLSPVFIKSNGYGTRSSTIIFVDKENKVSFIERTYLPNVDNFGEVRFSFQLKIN